MHGPRCKPRGDMWWRAALTAAGALAIRCRWHGARARWPAEVGSGTCLWHVGAVRGVDAGAGGDDERP